MTLPSGRPVVVAVGPQVLWFARVASHVLVLQLPAGDTPPPDKHTKVPAWMQKEITAAPTFGP